VIDQILAHLRTRAAREAYAGPRSPHRTGPPRDGARHVPRARPPRPRPPHEYRPRRPAPQRGRLACAAVPPRRHRGLRRPWPPPLTAADAALTAPGREAGHAAPLTRCWRGPRSRRTFDEWSTDPGLKFLSRGRPFLLRIR
jgi:hypothetical protein